MKIHEITDDTTPRRPHAGLAEAVLDPYVNAIHVSLLREKQLNPVYAEQLAKLGVGREEVRALGEKLLAEGPAQLTPAERLLIMADAARDGLAASASVAASGRIARAVVAGCDSGIQPPRLTTPAVIASITGGYLMPAAGGYGVGMISIPLISGLWMLGVKVTLSTPLVTSTCNGLNIRTFRPAGLDIHVKILEFLSANIE